MIPSSDVLAEQIRRLVDNLAHEIERRCHEQPERPISHQARAVLLDWFLGDFHP